MKTFMASLSRLSAARAAGGATISPALASLLGAAATTPSTPPAATSSSSATAAPAAATDSSTTAAAAASKSPAKAKTPAKKGGAKGAPATHPGYESEPANSDDDDDDEEPNEFHYLDFEAYQTAYWEWEDRQTTGDSKGAKKKFRARPDAKAARAALREVIFRSQEQAAAFREKHTYTDKSRRKLMGEEYAYWQTIYQQHTPLSSRAEGTSQWGLHLYRSVEMNGMHSAALLGYLSGRPWEIHDVSHLTTVAKHAATVKSKFERSREKSAKLEQSPVEGDDEEGEDVESEDSDQEDADVPTEREADETEEGNLKDPSFIAPEYALTHAAMPPLDRNHFDSVRNTTLRSLKVGSDEVAEYYDKYGSRQADADHERWKKENPRSKAKEPITGDKRKASPEADSSKKKPKATPKGSPKATPKGSPKTAPKKSKASPEPAYISVYDPAVGGFRYVDPATNKEVSVAQVLATRPPTPSARSASPAPAAAATSSSSSSTKPPPLPSSRRFVRRAAQLPLVEDRRMVRMLSTSSASNIKNPPQWIPNTQTTPDEFLRRLNLWFSISNAHPPTWLSHLAYAQSESSTQQALESLVKRTGESDASLYARGCALFKERYERTPMEASRIRLNYHRIKKGVTETITDYLHRYGTAYEYAFPGQPQFTEQNMQHLLFSLEEEMQRRLSRLQYTVDSTQVYHADHVNSWTALVGAVRAEYDVRNPQEKLQTMLDGITKYQAERASETMDATQQLLNADRDVRGTHSQTADQRSRTILHSPTATHVTEPRESELAAYRTLVKHHHPAAAAATSSYPLPRQQTVPRFRPAPAPVQRHAPARGHVKRVQTETRDLPAKRKQTSKGASAPAAAAAAAAAAPDEETPEVLFGPCPNCCLAHDWEFCPRNADGKRYSPNAVRWLNKGPHPKADPNDIASCKAANPELFPAETKKSVNRVRTGAAGQMDIVTPVTVKDVHVADALVDTGAQVSLMSLDFYNAHRASFGKLGPRPTFGVYDAQDAPFVGHLGTLALPLTLKDPRYTGIQYTRQVQFVVTQQNTNILLGLDILNKFLATCDFQTGTPTFRADLKPDSGKTRPLDASVTSTIRLSRPARLGPGVVKEVLVTYGRHLTLDPLAAILCQPEVLEGQDGAELSLTFPPHVQSAATTRRDKMGTYALRVENTSDYQLDLPAGLIIGSAQVLSLDPSFHQPPESKDPLDRVVRHIVMRPCGSAAHASDADISESDSDGDTAESSRA